MHAAPAPFETEDPEADICESCDNALLKLGLIFNIAGAPGSWHVQLADCTGKRTAILEFGCNDLDRNRARRSLYEQLLENLVGSIINDPPCPDLTTH